MTIVTKRLTALLEQVRRGPIDQLRFQEELIDLLGAFEGRSNSAVYRLKVTAASDQAKTYVRHAQVGPEAARARAFLIGDLLAAIRAAERIEVEG